MKITVYCLKGSAGKTPIATNLALDKEYALGTNEPHNILDTVIPEERLISIDPHEPFPQLPDDIDIVFDLAGMMSRDARESIISAVKQSNVVLVPIYNELKCLSAGIATIQELKEHTSNIVVIATKLQKQKGEVFKDWSKSADFLNIAHVLQETVGQGIPMLPLKFSKVFDIIFEKEMSINQLRAANALEAYTYREVSAQFDAIISYLEKHYA